MQNVPIKFRGITVKYKEVVYGYLFHCGDKAFIMSLVFYTAGEWEMQTDEVDPDSIAQLVGYDVNGEEVYEGDTVDAFFGTSKKPSHNFPAALSSNIETPTDLDFKFIRRN